MAAASILSATLSIAFGGLMLFQGPTTALKTHVSIVDAPHHDAFVHILGENEIPLKRGDTITFSGGRGVAKTDDDFDDHVITLKKHLLFGNIDREVVESDVDHDGTLATVTLPNGDLTVFRSFRQQVELDTAVTFASTHCFPRYVVLTTTTPVQTMTITDRWGKSTHSNLDGEPVVISNGGIPHGQTDTHFHEYRRLTASLALLENASFVAPDCDPKAPASDLRAEVRKKLDDRINRIPNGDCGPVDNP